MLHAINSFDVFDTLIARRCGPPKALLAILEQRAGLAGIASARIAADVRLGQIGVPYDIHDLWREVGRAINLDVERCDALKHLEIAIELEQVIPIQENLALVRDGDILISDTYLPVEVVRSLLDRAGLRRQVGIVATNDGKQYGWVWQQLLSQLRIEQHLGDNPHSDGRSPSEHGIRAIIYTGSAPTPIEQDLIKGGEFGVAQIIRAARLASPFAHGPAPQRRLWVMGCQWNFPLLWYASHWLARLARDRNVRQIHFVSRDGYHWHELFRRVFPEMPCSYMYASRLCQFHPSPSYLRYFDDVWQPTDLIVDLLSTGTSWANFFARREQRGRCCFIGHCDNFRYWNGANATDAWLQVHSIFATSELGCPASKGLEILNYAPHPGVDDVLWSETGGAIPVLADRLEYDTALPNTVAQAMAKCMEMSQCERFQSHVSDERLRSLVVDFARSICRDPTLAQLYPDNVALDRVYEQRLANGR